GINCTFCGLSFAIFVDQSTAFPLSYHTSRGMYMILLGLSSSVTAIRNKAVVTLFIRSFCLTFRGINRFMSRVCPNPTLFVVNTVFIVSVFISILKSTSASRSLGDVPIRHAIKLGLPIHGFITDTSRNVITSPACKLLIGMSTVAVSDPMVLYPGTMPGSELDRNWLAKFCHATNCPFL